MMIRVMMQAVCGQLRSCAGTSPEAALEASLCLTTRRQGTRRQRSGVVLDAIRTDQRWQEL